MLLMAILLIAPMADAQSKVNKQLQKERNKEYKVKLKNYKKDGWKVFGTVHTLEVSILSHLEKLDALGDAGTQIVGIAQGFRNKDLGRRMAVASACNDYAEKSGALVKGRLLNDMANDGRSPDNEFYKFYAAFEQLVEKELKGELVETYSVIRETSKGVYEMESNFIVDVDAVTRAVVRAYENAAKESEAAQKYAGQVSDFIKEGFSDIQK
jgi:hypothetical protein